MNNSQENFFTDRWCWLLSGAFFWWLLGLNLFVYHVGAIALLVVFLFHQNTKLKGFWLPPSAGLLFLLISIYLFSIGIHFKESGMSRVVAAIYNLSFWGMGFCLVVVLGNVFRFEQISDIYRAYRRVGWVVFVMCFLILILWGSGRMDFHFKTPLYPLTRVLGETSLIKNSLVVHPLLFDWLASATRPRLNLFSPYPTAAGGIIMICLYWLWGSAKTNGQLRNPLTLSLIGVNCFALLLTMSRMSILAFVASVIILFLLEKRNSWIWILLFIFVAVLMLPLIEDFSNWVLGLRQGSTTGRMNLYKYTLNQLYGIDWFLGKGIKPREDVFFIPIGSHSTYISLIFKTGIIGFLSFMLFQFVILWRWLKTKSYVINDSTLFTLWRVLGCVMISMGMWMLTEDIDAPQMLAFLYFSSVGIFEGLRKGCLSGNFLPTSKENTP